MQDIELCDTIDYLREAEQSVLRQLDVTQWQAILQELERVITRLRSAEMSITDRGQTAEIADLEQKAKVCHNRIEMNLLRCQAQNTYATTRIA